MNNYSNPDKIGIVIISIFLTGNEISRVLINPVLIYDSLASTLSLSKSRAFCP